MVTKNKVYFFKGNIIINGALLYGLVLGALFLVNTPLANSAALIVDAFGGGSGRNSRIAKQLDLVDRALVGPPSIKEPLNQDTKLARKELLSISINVSAVQAQLALAKAFVEHPVTHAWAGEVLIAQAKGDLFKTAPLSHDTQLYLWDSFKSAKPLDRKPIFRVLKSIPLFHLDIELEQQLVDAILDKTNPELSKPAKIILFRDLNLQITDDMLRQLNFIKKVYNHWTGRLVPEVVIKEAEALLSGEISLSLAQRYLVKWLNRGHILQNIAEKVLKNQSALFTATQFDLWKHARGTAPRLRLASQVAIRVLRVTPFLSFYVMQSLKATARNPRALKATREKALLILYNKCPMAFS